MRATEAGAILASGEDDSATKKTASTGRRVRSFMDQQSHRSELNRRPLDYESSALPLSYCGNDERTNMP